MWRDSVALPRVESSADKGKLLAVAEVLCVFAVIIALVRTLGATGWAKWEISTLGWSYTGALVFIGVPALVVWLTRRRWSDYGVTLADWRANLSIGLKAYPVTLIPFFLGFGGLAALKTSYKTIPGGVFMAVTEIAAIVIMLWIMRRQEPVTSGRNNLIIIGLLLILPVAIASIMDRLSVIVVSTIIWQFVLSGFGEEFAWRGYIQSRLNLAFGRPYRILGVSFGPGLIIAALLFGFMHALNTFDASIGLASLSWGWALWTIFAGLFLGVIREKTGSLLACSIAHGVPDAVGESLAKIFTLM